MLKYLVVVSEGVCSIEVYGRDSRVEVRIDLCVDVVPSHSYMC